MSGGSLERPKPTPVERAADIADVTLRWSRRNPLAASFTGALVISLILIITTDAGLAQDLKRGLHPHLFGFFKAITDVGLGGHWFALVIGAWVFSMIVSGLSLTTEAHERWRLHARSWLFALSNLILAGVALQAMKLLFGRYRPRYLFEDGLYGFAPFSGNNSFPSGHSQVVWSVAIAMWFIYPRYRAAYVAAAALISFSRVATTVHFLSDWVMGSVLAVVVGIWLQRRFEAEGRPSLNLARHHNRD